VIADGARAPLFFLPGASGNTRFWRPLAERLAHAGERVFFGWPGFGETPPDPRVRGLDDLVALVLERITDPVHLIAQSMGGVIAARAALARPDSVKSLVLAATSGGIDVAALGGTDWRLAFRAAYPGAPRWFEAARDDLSERLPELGVPVLLLWGDADPVSPVAVGERLATLLPNAELCVFEGGTHDLVLERAADVAPWVERHLAAIGE
jgi:poly(3-hydroxyoctanoate) depolymerase